MSTAAMSWRCILCGIQARDKSSDAVVGRTDSSLQGACQGACLLQLGLLAAVVSMKNHVAVLLG